MQHRRKGGRTALDFVHPSYHEAFWYAVQRELPIQRWWALLRERADTIFKDFRYPYPQFRDSERYLPFYDAVIHLAQRIAARLTNVPPWDPDWPTEFPDPPPDPGPTPLPRL